MSREMKVRVVANGKLGITATCTATGRQFEVVVDYSAWKKWQEGTLIQTAFAELTPQQREFIKSGTTPAELEALIGTEED
jgi:hypothetical protein